MVFPWHSLPVRILLEESKEAIEDCLNKRRMANDGIVGNVLLKKATKKLIKDVFLLPYISKDHHEDLITVIPH